MNINNPPLVDKMIAFNGANWKPFEDTYDFTTLALNAGAGMVQDTRTAIREYTNCKGLSFMYQLVSGGAWNSPGTPITSTAAKIGVVGFVVQNPLVIGMWATKVTWDAFYSSAVFFVKVSGWAPA